MEKATRIIYKVFLIVTIIFVLLVAYGTYYVIKTDKEKMEINK